MHKIRKLLILILLTMILGGIALIMNRYDKKAVDSQLAELLLPGGEKISPWTNDKDGISYYFIPSYVDFDDICISLREDNEIRIDNQVFHDGDQIAGLKIDQTYEMYDNKNTKHNIKFIQSRNVSTVFVTTVTGSMNAIYQSKKNKEAAKITVIDKDGNVDLTRTDSKIKGRGNVTWNKEKAPFAILFNEPESILGMQVSSKWVLLANAYDDSEVRNAIVFDTAKKVGLTETSDYKYVDLYLNGEYNGLYMICQSVDTFSERTDIDKDGIFLFAAELFERASEMNYILYAEYGKTLVDVRLPKKMDSEEQGIAEKIIANTDTAIIDGRNDIGGIIDLDSWAKKYLIDEIFENYDSGITSSYFYTRSRNLDSKVYAGPIWDYDNSMGNRNAFYGATHDPEILYANHEYRSKEIRILWYSELYSNPVFYNVLTDIFKNEFLPQLEMLIDNGIENLAKDIRSAKVLDDIRWEKNQTDEYEYLVEYLINRVRFLKRIWLDNEEYVEVTYYTPGDDSIYYRTYVLKGSALSDNLSKMDGFSESDSWYIDGTDEEYDFTLPVNTDIVLVKALNKESSGIISKIWNLLSAKKKLVEVGASIGAMLLALLLLQFRRRLKKGVR